MAKCLSERDQKGSEAEIDYLIPYQTNIITVEVKSGSTGSLKSLHLLMALKKFTTAIRINTDLPTQHLMQTKTHSGESHYQLFSMPFYLLGQLHRLLASQSK